MDRESLKSGSYEQQIHRVIPECKNEVLILSKYCVERLKNENGWVKKELEHLPEGLQKLADYHAIRVNAASFESDMRRVVNALIC